MIRDRMLAAKIALVWPIVKRHWRELRTHPDVPATVLTAGDTFEAAIDRWIAGKD